MSSNSVGQANAPIISLPYTVGQNDIFLLKVFKSSAAGAVFLPPTNPYGTFPISFLNEGPGTATLTPLANPNGFQPTINGSASLALLAGQSAVVSLGDDSNWYAQSAPGSAGSALPIAAGGTGATTAAGAISNLGGLTLLSGTFANKPASPTAGTYYFATDLGTGVYIVWNGTNWKPATGVAVIGQSSATGMAVTNTLTETVLASVTIPAGMLSANGSLRITTNWTYTNSANTKGLVVRYAATAGVGGVAYSSLAPTTSAATRAQAQIYNQNSASTQIAFSAGNGSFGIANTTVTSSVNTALASVVSINGGLANTGETITLQSYTVEWIEP